MSCHPRVTEWTTILHTRLPHLTKPHATVLTLWSLGMVLARSCALTAVSAFLATWLHRKDDTVREQLREFCYEATAKRGTARQELGGEHGDAGDNRRTPVEWPVSFTHHSTPEEPSHARQTPARHVQ